MIFKPFLEMLLWYAIFLLTQKFFNNRAQIYRVFVIYGRDKRILILGAIWMVGNMCMYWSSVGWIYSNP